MVAMQTGESLKPFKTKSGDTLEILYLEELSAQVRLHVIQFYLGKYPHLCVSAPVGGKRVLSMQFW